MTHTLSTANTKVLTAVSIFSGCGGLDIGAERTGKVQVVCAVDNDHWAVETYRRNLGAYAVEADVRDIDPSGLPCDLLLAGPPCQDFSTLWNHDGLKTQRGNLYREVARYLSLLEPKTSLSRAVNSPGSKSDFDPSDRDLCPAMQ